MSQGAFSVSCGQKKTEVALCLFNRASQASRPGFRLAPQVVSLHPRWVANCYWCRLSATLFYLSTLPPASPSLPSAVGRSSVPVGIGNITKAGRRVKKLGPLFPILFLSIFLSSMKPVVRFSYDNLNLKDI